MTISALLYGSEYTLSNFTDGAMGRDRKRRDKNRASPTLLRALTGRTGQDGRPTNQRAR